jgi:hypothetical protein
MKVQAWIDKAVCKGDTTYSSSSSRMSVLKQFIHDYCEVCPVAQECLDDSYKTTSEGWSLDDGYWTVRGGYLPTCKTRDPGRPKGSSTKQGDWEAKPVPLEVKEGQSMLQRGICNKSKHGIQSIADMIAGSCRACRVEDRARPKVERTHCSRGTHEWKNLIINKPDKNGYVRTECRECKNERDRRRRAARNRAKIAA